MCVIEDRMTKRYYDRGTSVIMHASYDFALAYVGWLCPALFGAIFNWPWWIVLVLFVPGVAWYFATEGKRFYRESRELSPRRPMADRFPFVYVLLALPSAVLPFVVLGAGFPARFCGLIIALDLIIMDLRYVRYRTVVSPRIDGGKAITRI